MDHEFLLLCSKSHTLFVETLASAGRQYHFVTFFMPLCAGWRFLYMYKLQELKSSCLSGWIEVCIVHVRR